MLSELTTETQLYPAVRDWFAAAGWTVRSEVKNCDVVATRDKLLAVIELKQSFNLKLLMQAAKRQRTADLVYVAIPKPTSLRSREWQDRCHLLRRLELGLIVVTLRPHISLADVVFHPSPYDRNRSQQRNQRKRQGILKELQGRNGDYNLGGSVHAKLTTAYRENAIYIACCLERDNPLSPKQLQAQGTGPKTGSILSKNYYGWFDRVARGKYRLSAQGQAEFSKFQEPVDYYRKKLQDANEPQGTESKRK